MAADNGRKVIHNELYAGGLVYRAPASAPDRDGYTVIAGYRGLVTREYSELAINEAGIPYERHGYKENGLITDSPWKRLSIEEFSDELQQYRLAVQGTELEHWCECYDESLKKAERIYNKYPEAEITKNDGSINHNVPDVLFLQEAEKTDDCESEYEEEAVEKKSPGDMISDGVLLYGVNVGRFIFEKENKTVYVITDLPHITASDVLMIYQISPQDYKKLLSMSCKNRIPDNPVPHETAMSFRKRFLCGESAYCERYRCTLEDADMTLVD